jgi:hypothetical protein
MVGGSLVLIAVIVILGMLTKRELDKIIAKEEEELQKLSQSGHLQNDWQGVEMGPVKKQRDIV